MRLMMCCVSKDDLVVGAPFYYERGVGGAIYIYLSGPRVSKLSLTLHSRSRDRRRLRLLPTFIPTVSNQAGSRFGSRAAKL